MNKILKGTIAGAAGITLLLGGASTFALWNDSASASGGTIVAGDLAVASGSTAPTWSINGGTPQADLTGFVAVPGDVITYTKVMSITAKGDALRANLTVDPASIKPVSSKAPADVALANYLTANAVLTATGAGISTGSAPYTITPGESGVAQDVTVSVTITFPKSTTPGFENNTQAGSVNLEALAVTLNQI
ncbi:alternate-type signal peptide domain-containing protein [Agreia pratensis]|uniref:Alternate signal-mediated exported protein, RER_14450 family n=1 Tax=Agreia pratensis TaxID=150121 RepID=A0A1X7I435_9MICO|nr:alternate-type signal peptide domain-containing protein [Agreia pratensis]MBF4633516.1 alternate-type signal peptide domain-containing protein [Agreia pratensis]SMG09190.1 alternate signal-mediated exported protein, RER_14450 family [Agreia pratensis]